MLAFLSALLLLGMDPMTPAVPDTITADHYRVYHSDGTPASLDALVAAMDTTDVLFLGEEHDDPVAHLLQTLLLQRAYTRHGAEGRPVALSLEMFERDVQYILDEYLAGLITEDHFRRSARPWPNYETDYRPMVEFARAHALPVLAANAPRRYTNRVARLGPEALAALPARARATLPPLPYADPTEAYRDKWNRLMQRMMAEMSPDEPAADAPSDEPKHDAPTHDTSTHDTSTDEPEHAADTTAAAPSHGMHGPSYLLEAQSLWDASMAYTIAEHLMAQPQSLVLHAVGGFHVEEGTGIPEHLRRYRPGTRSLVVAIRPHDDVETFDAERFAGLGDFVILTDAALPRSGATAR